MITRSNTTEIPARRTNVLLAPRQGFVPSLLRGAEVLPSMYTALLHDMQRLRGRMYMHDGLLSRDQMTVDGRHVSHFDERSWHMLTLEADGTVSGCSRMLIHPDPANYDQTFVATSELAKSSDWGEKLRTAVRKEVSSAQKSRVVFAETGGWAVETHLRTTTEAVKLALGGFAFGELLGGCAGVVTACLKTKSAQMLMRLGLKPLTLDGQKFPVYWDPFYQTDVAVLRFETFSYESKYRNAVVELRELLRTTPVVCSAEAHLHTPLMPAAPAYAAESMYLSAAA